MNLYFSSDNKGYQPVLTPALAFAAERKYITDTEYSVLKKIIQSDEMLIKAANIKGISKSETSIQRTRIINGLKEKRMITPLKEDGRIYTIQFANNYLLRSVMKTLEDMVLFLNR